MWIDISTIKEAVTNGVSFTLQSKTVDIVENNDGLHKENPFISITLFKDENKRIIISPIKQKLSKYLVSNNKLPDVDFNSINDNELLSVAGETLNIIVAYIAKKLNLSGEKTDISTPEYDFSLNDISDLLNEKSVYNIIVDGMLLFYFII